MCDAVAALLVSSAVKDLQQKAGHNAGFSPSDLLTSCCSGQQPRLCRSYWRRQACGMGACGQAIDLVVRSNVWVASLHVGVVRACAAGAHSTAVAVEPVQSHASRTYGECSCAVTCEKLISACM